MAISPSVFFEYEDVLTRPESLSAFELSTSDMVRFLRFIAYISAKFDPQFLFRPNLKDEADNMFVELAVVSQSQYLITSNIRDYISGELRFDDLRIITPAEFVKKWRLEHE